MEIQDDLDVLRKATGALVEWEEEKHPRGEGGKFAPKGTTKPPPKEDEDGETATAVEEDEGKTPVTERHPDRKVEGGVEDEIDDHKGVWIDMPDKDWTIFVRDGETLEEAYGRQLEEAVNGDWGEPAQKFARKLQREEARKKRAEAKSERAKMTEAEREARAAWEGEENVPKFTREQFAMIEDAKKLLMDFGESPESAKKFVHTAARIGFMDFEDLVQSALHERRRHTGKEPEKPKSEKPKTPVAPATPADHGKAEYEQFIEEYFGEEKPGPNPDLDLEEDELLEQLFGPDKPEEEEEKPGTPNVWEQAQQEERHTPPPEEEIEAEPYEVSEEEYQEIVGGGEEAPPGWGEEEFDPAKLDEILSELMGDVPPPPEFSEEDERAMERRRQKLQEEARAEEERRAARRKS